MHAYRLSWKDAPPAGILSGQALRADHLGRMAPSEVQRQPLRAGRRNYTLGELFDIVLLPDRRGPWLAIDGAEHFVYLGAGQEHGVLEVHGPAGAYAGAGLRGGELHVHGHCGPRAGAGMRGGLLSVYGDVASLLGGPLPGEAQGMTGGEIFVAGNAGSQVGMRMRRGTIAIAGKAEEGVGQGLLAGTIVVCSEMPPSAGYGMARGSIISLQAASRTPAVGVGFSAGGIVQPPYWRILWRRLKSLGLWLDGNPDSDRFQAHHGDRLSAGRGELLFRV